MSAFARSTFTNDRSLVYMSIDGKKSILGRSNFNVHTLPKNKILTRLLIGVLTKVFGAFGSKLSGLVDLMSTTHPESLGPKERKNFRKTPMSKRVGILFLGKVCTLKLLLPIVDFEPDPLGLCAMVGKYHSVMGAT